MALQPKTFEQWLSNYIDKASPRGDLARDYARECRRVGPDHAWDLLEIGCDEARQTYRRARLSYQQYVRRYNGGTK